MNSTIHLTVEIGAEMPQRFAGICRRGFATLAVLLGLCGCEAAPPSVDMQQPPPLTVQLGTINAAGGDLTTFVDLNDGQQVQLAPGAQGGFHVWLLYKVGGNDQARQVDVERIADRIGVDDSRQRVLTATNSQQLPAQPLWQLPTPQPSFMCPTPIGVSVLDAPIELLLRILPSVDTSGPPPATPPDPLGEARVRILPMCPPVGDPQRDFCLRICQG